MPHLVEIVCIVPLSATLGKATKQDTAVVSHDGSSSNSFAKKNSVENAD
jgi:hypothetical protein